MAHGTPDWGVTAGARTVYQLTDLAELAARLGSPVTFDRRGDVIFIEQFAQGLQNWIAVHSLPVGTVQLSALRYRTTPFAVRCTPASGSALIEGVERHFSYRATKNVGVELHFNLGTSFTGPRLRLVVFTGTQRQIYVVRYDPLADVLERSDSTGALVAVDPAPNAFFGLGAWIAIKLVVDTNLGQYRRLLFGQREYNLLGAAGQNTASAAVPEMEVDAEAFNVDTTAGAVWFDDIIVTINEPD